MKVWVINPYGNIPGEGWRTYRTTLIANAFVANGHQVVSWVSNIQHRSKEKRAETWKDVQVNPNYLIKIVPSTGYSGHISLARIKYERTYAKNLFAKALETDEKPDLIILGEPALFIFDIIKKLVRQKEAALVIDVIDLWPELFNILLPNRLDFLGKLIFAPLYYRRNLLFKKADGIMAVARDYLQIGLKAKPTVPGAVVYWGLNVEEVKVPIDHDYQKKELNELDKKDGEVWLIYAGTLGSNYDIDTLLQCGLLLAKRNVAVKLLIAGDGPLKEMVEQFIATEKLTNVTYLGSLLPQDLNLLYTKCDIALSSYVLHSTVSMPIKAYDYLAAGLPLVNSLGRDLGSFVTERKVGIQYEPENAEAMFAAVLQLANDQDLRLQMKKNALLLADEFDAVKQYQKAVVLAEKVLQINRR
jgi:glycosyltransferase involved in cell wall biosynthesis